MAADAASGKIIPLYMRETLQAAGAVVDETLGDSVELEPI
jgi:hypothetical protein